ncbi:site-specific DNA-methyltransferase [Pseudomonas sp. SWI44]|uniref:site-specific DNA-methyltransferase n=1 Tax=Pseudomonas sp. SWI44 TaxID=2083053 RepID=UPI000CE5F676|nr:site-specific DNA-methyltransferase [Pseudomonas sp. SWI44]AVD88552.1 site-specific DNA-methyltransferase [Pseudomonas sp. SWI44]
MPTLNWIGKEAVVRHHKDVPFRLLEPVRELSCGDNHGKDSGNLIVQGDNLHALKALLPRYAGQVKCIYIDPPYNTGNEGWVYNDNVSSPEIRKWLGEVVGKEGETLDRHDRWLCMMYPRLVLLKQFLRDDGAIFVSIDDNEVATLRLLMDEIFGANNFVTQIEWQKIYTVKNSARYFSEMHDHIICFAKNKHKWSINLIPRASKQDDAFKNPDNDPRGPWKATPFHARNVYSQGLYEIESPVGKRISPPSGTYWRYSRDSFDRMLAEDRIWWGKNGEGVPAVKRFLSEVKDGVTPTTLWLHEDAGHNAEAKNEVREILSKLPSETITPKPIRLIQRILQIATDKDSLILDSFAGSGTTGHAVLQQNAEDAGSRRFILVEMGEGLAQNMTAERVRRVAQGYSNAKEQSIEGLGGGFQFCRLSEHPLFNADGQIRSDVTFAQLAEFVWFAETGTGFVGQAESPLLGVHEGRAIYLLYNGILKDKSVSGGNVLTGPVLDVLPTFAGPKVIYAAANRLGARAAREGITFKQTPYALEV